MAIQLRMFVGIDAAAFDKNGSIVYNTIFRFPKPSCQTISPRNHGYWGDEVEGDLTPPDLAEDKWTETRLSDCVKGLTHMISVFHKNPIDDQFAPLLHDTKNRRDMDYGHKERWFEREQLEKGIDDQVCGKTQRSKKGQSTTCFEPLDVFCHNNPALLSMPLSESI
jgi:hypothetical protein